MAEPLATTDDLDERLGRTLAGAELDRAAALLRDASATIRGYTGQQFTQATTTDRFRVRPRQPLVLPQRPVTAVSAVTDINGTAVAYTWDGIDRIEMWADIGAINGPSYDTFSGRPLLRNLVDVTSTHGYADIPDDVVAIACQMVGRSLGRPLDDQGLTETTLDGYGEKWSPSSASGAVALTDDERAVLDRYVPSGLGSTRVSYGYGIGASYR